MVAFFKFLFSFCVLAIALLPTWLFLLVRHFATPQGFWQNIVLFGFSAYFLGGLQIIFLVIGIICIAIICKN